MNYFMILTLATLLSNITFNAHAEVATVNIKDSIKRTVIEDYKNYYSGENLGKLAIGIGAAGVFANTPLDKDIQKWYQESVRNGTTYNISKIAKKFGDHMLTVPVFCGAALFGELLKETTWGAVAGQWGKRSLRTILVGEPPMLLMQRVLGASRPEEGNSGWHFFNDDNGVSGHSFIGAISFLTAADMTDSLYLKYALYLGSTMAGLSRLNDNDHYFSQVALGWWMAYVAVRSVEKTEKWGFTISPVVMNNGSGIVITLEY